MKPDDLEAFVKRTCDASGVSVEVTDPEALEVVGRIMTPARLEAMERMLARAEPIPVDPRRAL
jgi:hypothetical protein